MARPTAPLVLTDDETQALTTWASQPKSTQRLALRARIILACARGLDNKAVAVELDICAAPVGTWRKRLVERRLEKLSEEPRPGAPRKIDDAVVKRGVSKILETKPETAPHAGAWIEPHGELRSSYQVVAPHAGAWIETGSMTWTSWAA